MRVFVAVEISKGEILKKIQTFQKNVGIDAKPTKIDQIHFTLEFLGEIDQVKYDQVKDVMEEISFSSFDISLKGVGVFPNLKNPRVIWIGIDENGAEKLISIANEVGIKLKALGSVIGFYERKGYYHLLNACKWSGKNYDNRKIR